MRAGFPLLLILLIGLAPLGALTTTILNDSGPFSFEPDSDTTIGDTTIQTGMNNIPVPGPDLGQANWSLNHYQNPGFEDWTTPNVCDGWTVSKTGDRHHWIESSQISEGSYSGGFHCQNYPTQSEIANLEQSTLHADFTNITFSFDWYLDQNEDPSQDVMYGEVQLQDGTFTYWLFYYLNGTSAIDQNTTWEGYFLFDNYPSQQWNTISRNLTADFLAVSELAGSYSENLYVDNIRFRLESLGGTDQLIRGYIDDVKLYNATYDSINGSIRNGNFETGDFTSWTVFESTDTGHFEQSSTAFTGSYSANVTAYSVGNQSETRIRDYPYSRLTSLNQGHVSMWWNLTYQNLSSNTYAYIVFQGWDGAVERDVYYMLGYGGITSPIVNSSRAVVLKPDNFNTTGSWNHLDVNLWTDVNSRFSPDELMVRYVEVVTIAEGTDALIYTLIDTVNFRAAAVNLADFEDQPDVGQRVQGFTTTSSRMTVTGTAYGGSKAGNITQTSGTVTLRQAMQWRPLNSSRETYLDVMWRIEDTIPANQVWFRLTFTDDRELNYYVNGLPIGLLNDSLNGFAYFNITGAGTMGVWMQLHRDLAHDYEAVFGSLPDTTMENLYLRTSTSGRLEILFDDFYLYDDPAPQVSSMSRTPTNPDHQEAVQVSADAIDQDLETILVYYRVDSGSWQEITMVHQSGDTYRGTIPGQDHNAGVEYYVTANDTWGLTTTALDGGSYWSYTVTDQTAPSIDNIIQTPSPVGYQDTVNVTAEITEEGSGLQSIELFYRIDGGAWQNTPMVTTGFTGYYATIGQQSYNTLVEYYVNATDNMDLQGISGTYSYTVTDTIPPVITNVAHTPIPVEYTDSPAVSCNVTDVQSGISTVVIYYRVNGGGWNTVSMTPTTGTGFAGDIPAQAWDAQVDYYINATDNAGAWDVDDNSGTYYSYTVSDSVNPQISNINQNPSTVEYSDSPIISCDASDAGSGIASVTLYYRVNGGGWYTVAMSPTTGDQYQGSIPTQSWNDFVEYYIVVIDNAANSVTDDNSGTYYNYTVEDNTDPIISNVGHSPLTVTPSDTVTVGCDVTDAGSGVSTVTLWYRSNFGGWSSVAMSPTTGDHFETTIGAMPYATFVEYYVVATDAAGNSATEDNGGSYYNYTVTETTPPNVTSVSHSPTPVEYSDSPVVSCDVTDTESGVGTVTLYYRVNSGGWYTVAMNPTTGDSYEGVIPAQAWNDLVEYYVNATDNLGNFAVNDNGGSYYSYTVQDNTDPSISNIGRIPINVEYTDSPVVSCDASDSGSGIDYVRLYYRIDGGSWTWVAMTHTTGNHYETTLSTYAYDSLVEYYFVARDNAANMITDDNTGSFYSYRVDDFTDPLISNVDHSPSTVEYDDAPIVGCDVTDVGSGVSAVVLYYRVDGGSWTQVSMSVTAIDHYEGTIPVQVWNSVVQYYLNATDVAGNWDIDDNLGSYYGYTVVDNTDPVISNVGHTPVDVTQFVAAIVGCDVVDPGSGVGSVQLHYRVDGGSWNLVAMSFTSGNHYEGTIPVQALNAFVEYYIDATDNAANNAVEDNGGSNYTYTVGDLNPPVISEVGHTPSPVQYSDTPVILCNVTDVGSGVANAVLAYRIDGGIWMYVAMAHTTGNRYEYTMLTQPFGTFVEYWINATDNVGNWQVEDNTGSYYTYTVIDSINPVISDMDTAPANVEYSATPTIGCDVSDAGTGIDTALLVYRIDAGSWITLILTHTSGDHYSANLPSQPWQTQVDYYFNITDNAGNSLIDDNSGSYYSYTVIDTTNPSATISSPAADAILTGAVEISISADDEGSGVARIEIAVDGVEIAELTSSPFTFTWNTTLVLDGNHTITITAFDNAGNQVTDSIEIFVLNATAPPPIPGFPFEALFVGLLLTIGGILYSRRRKRVH